MSDTTIVIGEETHEIVKPVDSPSYCIVWEELMPITYMDEHGEFYEVQEIRACAMTFMNKNLAEMHLRYLWDIGITAQMLHNDDLTLPMMRAGARCWDLEFKQIA